MSSRTRIADDFEALREQLQERGVLDKPPELAWTWKQNGAWLIVDLISLQRMALLEDGTGKRFRLHRDEKGNYSLREIE